MEASPTVAVKSSEKSDIVAVRGRYFFLSPRLSFVCMVLHGRVIVVYGFVELAVRMMMMPRIVGRNGTRPQLDDIPCNGIDHPAEQGAFLRSIKSHWPFIGVVELFFYEP